MSIQNPGSENLQEGVSRELTQGFPWGTQIGKSLISDLCTEIVLFWWDFYLQGQHWDFGLDLSLGISQKALLVKEIMGFEDVLS